MTAVKARRVLTLLPGLAAVVGLSVGCSGNAWTGYEVQCAQYVEQHGEALLDRAGRLAGELGGTAEDDVYCDDSGGPPASVSVELDPAVEPVEQADLDVALSADGWTPEVAEGLIDGERWYVADDGEGTGLLVEWFDDGSVEVDVVGPDPES
jgi:hypothetical protein